jgi:hypothetical protein
MVVVTFLALYVQIITIFGNYSSQGVYIITWALALGSRAFPRSALCATLDSYDFSCMEIQTCGKIITKSHFYSADFTNKILIMLCGRIHTFISIMHMI